jgi:hypothetical protein
MDCPLGARRKRAQRVQALSFAVALVVIATAALGLRSPPQAVDAHKAEGTPSAAVELSRDSAPIRRPVSAYAPPAVPSQGSQGTGYDSVSRDQLRWTAPIADVVYRGPLSATSLRPNVDATVRSRIYPGTKRCYLGALKSDPSLGGRLTLVLNVPRAGDVDEVTVEGGGRLARTIGPCLTSVARRAQFDPSDEAETLRVTFDFLSVDF